MTDINPQRFEIIPIDEICVLNPRTRNRHQHREITENIANIGLKRPITVSCRTGGGCPGYNLVCGQGRLEAFRILGETEIPAIVIDAPEGDCLVMSLVENIARRQHGQMDLLQEIRSLHNRGYSDTEIGQKVGMTTSWANMILNLLDRGEERLIRAAETGLIPIRFAVDIARANSAEVQDVLMDAYSSGQIKGKRLAAVRRLLENRAKHTKAFKEAQLGRKRTSRKIATADLMRLYQREADKQRLLVKKSNYTQTKLLFLVEALRELLSDERFATLLRAEQLDSMPRALTARIKGEHLQ